MRRARFVAAALREFLAEVAYYSKERADLGARFTAAVEEATARAVAFPWSLFNRPIHDAHFAAVRRLNRNAIDPALRPDSEMTPTDGKRRTRRRLPITERKSE